MSIENVTKDELVESVENWVNKTSAHSSSIGNSENAVITEYAREMEQAKSDCLSLIEKLYSQKLSC
jgi:hypothetical protein